MPTLYIANCTKQNHDFLFSVPENNRLRMQTIPMGGQAIIVGKGLTTESIKAIVEQHERYGLIDVKNINQTKSFIGLCYSIDREIKVDQIMKAHLNNEEFLIDQGTELRKQSLAALSNITDTQDGQPGPTSLGVEVIEQGSGDERLIETIDVVKEGVEPKKRGRRRVVN